MWKGQGAVPGARPPSLRVPAAGIPVDTETEIPPHLNQASLAGVAGVAAAAAGAAYFTRPERSIISFTSSTLVR